LAGLSARRSTRRCCWRGESGKWLLKILARDNRFVFGVYRRHMKVISYLGTFDRLFGIPVTTRNWNTITAIARVLGL
jgi:hypothetical protein